MLSSSSSSSVGVKNGGAGRKGGDGLRASLALLSHLLFQLSHLLSLKAAFGHLDFRDRSPVSSSFIYLGKEVSNIIKLIPHDFEDLKTFWGFEEELGQLQESLNAIADLVEEAEEKQKNWRGVRRWLRNLKFVAYEADELLSDLAYETTRLQIENQEVSFFANLKAYARNAGFRFIMAHKLKKVTRLLRNLYSESQSYCGGSQSGTLRLIPLCWDQNRFPVPADSILDSPLVGREADVSKIVNLLTSFCSQQFTIVPIVAPSLGKTALAKAVCQIVMKRRLYDVTLWVCVSSLFDEYRILKEMLGQLNPKMRGLTNSDAIFQQLRGELGRKRFVLVLDDVPGDVYAEWNYFKAGLSQICTNCGNAIIVTTCSKEVVLDVAGSTQHGHVLGLLSSDECWSILKERAFRNVRTSITSKLEAIGQEIANECRGVPLVAKVLGGIMGYNLGELSWLRILEQITRYSRNENSWFIIRDNSFMELEFLAPKVEKLVRSMLNVSFDHLPSCLKPCFAFCSIFPKGFSVRKEDLIQLWIAEGFVESCDEGNNYFDHLLANSFFEDAETDDNGVVVQCKMHNLLHDFASLLFEVKLITNSLSLLDFSSYLNNLSEDYLCEVFTSMDK